MSHHHHRPEPPTSTLHTRREFLRTSMLGAAAAWTLPIFLQKTFFTLDAMAGESAVQYATGKDQPILVVLQMAGGNDGLNTVIPFADDLYHRARPLIGIKPEQVLKLNDYAGLHPKLTGLKELFDQGHLALIQGVGYPNPNRSHFRSTEIWQTASDAESYENHGWLGKYFDSCCAGADPTVGVAIGNSSPQAFSAKNPKGVSFAKPEQYRWIHNGKGPSAADSEALFKHLNQSDEIGGGGMSESTGSSIGSLSGRKHSELSPLDFLQRTALDAQLSSDKVLEISRKGRPIGTSAAPVQYPQTPIGDNLNLVGKMIAGGLPTRVYYVSQGGFDTHSAQTGTHDRLMGELDQALTAFCQDLQAQGNFNRVLLMTFSEFGRRVSQNASGGTDHGAAAPMFVLGGGVKPGIFGKHPSLSQLNNGDLMYNVDFRSVYATVLDNWLKAPSQRVLGRKFPSLPFV